MKITNIHEAKTHLSHLIECVNNGEEIIIAKSGKPVAKLVPYQQEAKPRVPGFWQGKVKMSEDFDKTPEFIVQAFN